MNYYLVNTKSEIVGMYHPRNDLNMTPGEVRLIYDYQVVDRELLWNIIRRMFPDVTVLTTNLNALWLRDIFIQERKTAEVWNGYIMDADTMKIARIKDEDILKESALAAEKYRIEAEEEAIRRGMEYIKSITENYNDNPVRGDNEK